MIRAMARLFFVIVAGFVAVSACSDDPLPPKIHSMTEDIGSLLPDPIPSTGGTEAPLAGGAAASPFEAPVLETPPPERAGDGAAHEVVELTTGPPTWEGEPEVWDDGGPFAAEGSLELVPVAGLAAGVATPVDEEQASATEEDGAGEVARVRSPSPEVDSMSVDERGELIRRLLGVYASLGSAE